MRGIEAQLPVSISELAQHIAMLVLEVELHALRTRAAVRHQLVPHRIYRHLQAEVQLQAELIVSQTSQNTCTYVQVQPDLHESRFEVAVRHVEPDCGLCLALGAWRGNIGLQGPDIVLGDHGEAGSLDWISSEQGTLASCSGELPLFCAKIVSCAPIHSYLSAPSAA